MGPLEVGKRYKVINTYTKSKNALINIAFIPDSADQSQSKWKITRARDRKADNDVSLTLNVSNNDNDNKSLLFEGSLSTSSSNINNRNQLSSSSNKKDNISDIKVLYYDPQKEILSLNQIEHSINLNYKRNDNIGRQITLPNKPNATQKALNSLLNKKRSK